MDQEKAALAGPLGSVYSEKKPEPQLAPPGWVIVTTFIPWDVNYYSYSSLDLE